MTEQPWLDEPDTLDGSVGDMPWMLRRGPLGSWCGYVGVTDRHPWHAKDYDQVDVEVHGGLTYGGWASTEHAPIVPGLWWLGFDCAHAWDLIPGMLSDELPASVTQLHRESKNTYRTMSYAQSEAENLALQAIEAMT